MAEIKLPMVSIIAPCRNEAAFIEDALNSILQSDYPAERMELLVVDGMSTDGTRDTIQKIVNQDSRIKLIDNPKHTVPAAMNIGIKAARGEYILRIDCHCKFAPDYVRKCIEIIKRTGADNVGGYCATLAGADTNVARAIATATSSAFGVGNAMFRLGGSEREVDTVPFGTYRKEIFDRIGMYDERLVRNQDIELNWRIRKAGGRIIISPEIKVVYYNRATYRGLWQQAFNNGLWNPYTIWLIGGGLSLRHFVPMFFVLSLIILTAVSFFLSIAKWILLVYTALYLSVAVFFSLKHSRSKDTSAILVLWSYVVLHIAYGLGSIWSVLTIPFYTP
jgi:glycosyltransferase involved in cell wall biosynthesis